MAASTKTITDGPRLTVVRDGRVPGRFSALPHDIIRNTSLSRDARLLVATLLMYGWQGAEITASHATLASDMGCSLRSLRAYLNELIGAGIIDERDAGVRRQKVYALASNASETSDCPPVNTKVSTVQSESFDTFNTSKLSHSKKKTPVKKTKEEDLAPSELVAARAAEPVEAPGEPEKSARRTRCPETFTVEERHIAYGKTLGFNADRVRAETEQFLAHHRFKGTLGTDWYAGWQNWLRRARTYDAARSSAARRPAPAPSRVMSDEELVGDVQVVRV